MIDLQNWYFTFPLKNYWLRDYVVVIYATYDDARNFMLDSFGKEWSWQYSEKQFNEFTNEYKQLGEIVVIQ